MSRVQKHQGANLDFCKRFAFNFKMIIDHVLPRLPKLQFVICQLICQSVCSVLDLGISKTYMQRCEILSSSIQSFNRPVNFAELVLTSCLWIDNYCYVNAQSGSETYIYLCLLAESVKVCTCMTEDPSKGRLAAVT